ncbi:MAG: porin [Betaproteobacteria bacterium]
MTKVERTGRGVRRAAQLALLCVVLALGLACPALADPFTELPLRHWSFDSLGLLVAPGLVSESALSSYRSRPGVMRFELALLVAQAVQTMDRASGGQTRPLTAAEHQALRRLAAEFAPELELLGVRSGSLVSPEALSLPTSAPGPFVDLETLARLASQPEGSPAARVVAEDALPATVAIASPKSPVPLAPLPEQALSRQGEGPFPGQVTTEKRPTFGAVPSPKPVLSVSAAVQPGEMRLPAPGLNLSVSPTVQVSGSLAPGGSLPGSGDVRVEAKVNVAGVEVGANVRNVQPGSTGTNAGLKVGVLSASQGYGLTLKLGQVAVTTGVTQVKKDLANIEQRRSFEVGYSLGQTAVVRAGYQLVDVDTVSPTKQPSRAATSLGVDVNLTPSAALSAGMTLEGTDFGGAAGGVAGRWGTAGVELRLPWKVFLTAGYEFYQPSGPAADTGSQSATTLGVGYNFATNATLLVGYRLIDFGPAVADGDQTRQHNLTAGVSLSF